MHDDLNSEVRNRAWLFVQDEVTHQTKGAKQSQAPSKPSPQSPPLTARA